MRAPTSPGDPRAGGGGVPHDYKFEVETMCSASKAFDKLKRPGNSAPEAPGAQEGTTTGIMLTGNNPITQVANSKTMNIRNITEREHRYHPGTVDIRVRPGGRFGAGSTITATGTGTGEHPVENEILGQALFHAKMSIIAKECMGAVK